jgi:hypothetical protein
MKEFKDKYIKIHQNTVRRARVFPGDKIRIAVIDSGVRSEDPDIMAADATKRIRDYRNFTSLDPSDCEDEVEDGHGTLVSRLLLDVAPMAELYIAKVSRQRSIPRKELYRIADVSNIASYIALAMSLSKESR